jgi:hypothetical protein
VFINRFRQYATLRLIAPVLILSVLGFSLSPAWLAVATAAADVTLSGRVYNSTTGAGYSGVRLDLCGAGAATTGASGNWSIVVPVGTAYCARVVAGAPAGLSGPAVRNNPEVGGRTSYEYQRAGENCYRNPACDANLQQWDRAVDGGLDFAYGATVAAPPPAAPAATPASIPAATPAAPTPPADVKAELGEATPPEVKLTWRAADPAAVSGYRLERSLDRETWNVIAEKITEASYTDQDVSPDVHYYYRLVALAPSGQASEPALVDLAITKVLGEAAQTEVTYTSSDGVASVVVPAGVAPPTAKCTVVAAPGAITPGRRTILVGPYEFVCRDDSGSLIKGTNQEITWRFVLGDKMHGATPPQLVRASASGQPETVASGYDKSKRAVSAKLPADARLAVLETPIDWSWVNWAIIGGLTLGIIIVMALLPLRHKRKLSYQEYLRAKYYNL